MTPGCQFGPQKHGWQDLCKYKNVSGEEFFFFFFKVSPNYKSMEANGPLNITDPILAKPSQL